MENRTVFHFDSQSLRKELDDAQDSFLTQGLNYQAAFLRVGHVINRMKTEIVTREGGDVPMPWYQANGYRSWKHFCVAVLEPEYRISEERSHQLIKAWSSHGEVQAYIMTQTDLKFLSQRRSEKVGLALVAESTYRAVHGLTPQKAVEVIEAAQIATGKDVPSYSDIKAIRMGQRSHEERVRSIYMNALDNFDKALEAVDKLNVVHRLELLEKLLGELNECQL